MSWRLAKSLETLLSQINALSPQRSKKSDGTKGDAAHAARKSDHNPDADGIVRALDITHDPAHGIRIQTIADVLVKNRDARISYIICNGKIVSSSKVGNAAAWTWRKYSGANKHDKHIHISVKGGDARHDARRWRGLEEVIPRVIAPAEKAPKPATPKPAAPADIYTSKAMVQVVQGRLVELGYPLGSRLPDGTFDGRLGTLTKSAIRDFRADNSLPEGEAIDAAMVAALDTAKPRKLAPAREDADAGKVREAVPEVRSNWLTKIGGYVVGIPAAVGALFNGVIGNLGVATSYIQPVKDAVGDVPGWVWMLAIAVIAGGLVLVARHGEQKGIEAFRTGARL